MPRDGDRIQAEQLKALTLRLQQLSLARRAQPTEEFLRSLRHNEALIRAAAQSGDVTVSSAWLAAVQSDLEVKVHYLAAADQNLGYNVSVSVVTKRKGHAVDGYKVGLVPLYQRNEEPDMLDTVSSPATGEVTAGRYQVVVRLPTAEVAREVHRIGLDGRSTANIEILVP